MSDKKYKGFNSKAAFLGYIRSGLRRMWSKTYQPRRDFILANRVKVPLGKNQKLIWGGKCSTCKKDFKLNELEVDHIKPNHPLTKIEDIGAYCDTNFCETDNMQWTCKPCHKIKTYADRHGISFKEAKAEKKAIAFTKFTIRKQKALLETWGVMEDQMKNEKLRRAEAKKHYLK